MKYNIQRTSKFKKTYKLISKRKQDLNLLKEVVSILAHGEKLPEKYKDHALIGNYIGYRECHITADWLLIYRIYEDKLTLIHHTPVLHNYL